MDPRSTAANGAHPLPGGGWHGGGPPSASLLATALVATLIQLLQACSFTPPDVFRTPEGLYGILNAAPYADDATASDTRWRVIDAPKLKVDHGYGCASATHAASEEYVGMKIYGSATLPPGFDGTVLQNGWYLEYLRKDHHVAGMGSVIFNIAQSGTHLGWDAGGVLSDKNGDDGYRWCYQYTIVAWERDNTPPWGLPKARVDMNAIHADQTGRLVFVEQTLDGRRIRTGAQFKTTGAPPAAKLHTGFGVGFKDNDHHLLQFGFDLGPSKIRGRRIKWKTDVILKDNSRRSYYAAQVASVLRGASVAVWKPGAVLLEKGHPQAPVYIQNDLRLAPQGASNACLSGPSSKVYEFKITGVPFTWAVPMLTGWDVSDACNDEHVKKIGAWIENFRWVRNPGDSTGTLHYTVRTILEDKKPFAGIADGMQVEVLGIDLLEPPGKVPTFGAASE